MDNYNEYYYYDCVVAISREIDRNRQEEYFHHNERLLDELTIAYIPRGKTFILSAAKNI